LQTRSRIQYNLIFSKFIERPTRRVPAAIVRTCDRVRAAGSGRGALERAGPDRAPAGRRNAGMSDNRYAVGSTVYIWRRPGPGTANSGAYAVVAHYPSESSGRLYRVRSVLGTEERMVPEAELSTVPRSADAIARTPHKRRSA